MVSFFSTENCNAVEVNEILLLGRAAHVQHEFWVRLRCSEGKISSQKKVLVIGW